MYTDRGRLDGGGWQKERRFALALVRLLLRSFHSTSDQFRLACVIKSGELLSSFRREWAKTWVRRHREACASRKMTKRYVDVRGRTLGWCWSSSSRDLSSLLRRHFQQRGMRDHLRAARVFDKPVKARPRICLPLAFVTLLVLWLDSELTWKKGPRWYPEQTVRVCPGSTRRTPLSVTVACSPTANTQYRTDTFHRTSRPIIIRETDPNCATDLSFRHRPNNYYETRRESLSMEIRSEWI